MFMRKTLFCWPETTVDNSADFPGILQNGSPDLLGEYGFIRPAIVRTDGGGVLQDAQTGQAFTDRGFKCEWIIFDSPSDGGVLLELFDYKGAVIGTVAARPGSYFRGEIGGYRVVSVQKMAGPAVAAILIGSGTMPNISASLDWGQPVTTKPAKLINDADLITYMIDYPATTRPVGSPSTFAFYLGSIPSPARIVSIAGGALCGLAGTQFSIIGKISDAAPSAPGGIQPLIGAGGGSGLYSLPNGWFVVVNNPAIYGSSIVASFDTYQSLVCPAGSPGTNLYLYLMGRCSSTATTTVAAYTTLTLTVQDH